MGSTAGPRRPNFGLLCLLMLLALLLAGPAPAGSATAPVLSLSDVHFDPFAQPSLVTELAATPAAGWESVFASSGDQDLGSWGSETNHALLASALAAMAQAQPDPALVVFTGDILAHEFNDKYLRYTGDSSQSGLRSFIEKTVDYVTTRVADAFPSAPVYFCLGNNDSYNGDYRIAPQGAFLSDAGSLLANHFLKSQADRDSFLATFRQGGYYSLALPGGHKTRVIGINSIFFSVDYQDPGETRLGYDPATRELDWLAGELDAAHRRGEKVWLLCHIPPSINVYDVVHDPANSLQRMTEAAGFWKPAYAERFLSLLRSYDEVITATLCGHTHMDDFCVVFPDTAAIAPSAFMHINPAVSPQFGNNPAFKVFSVDQDDLSLADAEAYRLDLGQASPSWAMSYDFNQTYGRNGMNAHTLNWVRNRLAYDDGVAASYMLHYNADNTVSPFNPAELRAYWAGMAEFNQADYIWAYNHKQEGPPVEQAPAAAAAGQ